MGISFVAVTIAALAGVPGRDAGIASGLVNTSRQIGGAIGLAAVTTIATSAAGGTTLADTTHGYRVAFGTLAVILAERLRRVNDLLMEAHYVDADVRVRRRLVELAEAFGGPIPLTQGEIAQTAGTSRATVNRVLREEEAAGAVELARSRTTITDAAGLQQRGRGLT